MFRRKAFLPVLIILILSLFISDAYAFFNLFGGPKKSKDGTVFGIVIGPSNVNEEGARYSPIEGATVELRGPSDMTFNTMSDKQGGFMFQKVKPGDWVVTISKPGYGTIIRKFTLKDMETKRIENISLVPGGGVATEEALVVPDTVYVAFAKIESDDVLNGKNRKIIAQAVAAGADPFALDGNAPLDYSSGLNPYDKGNQISTYENTLMTIDPQDTSNVGYLKLDGRPTWLLFNVAGTKLYVATDSNSVLIYDVMNSTIVVGSIICPSLVTSMTLSHDGRWLFVAHLEGQVMVIDTKTHNPVNKIELPAMYTGERGAPVGMALSPDGSKLYVALSTMNAGEVVAIDAYTKQPVARGPVGCQPADLKMSPDGSKLYVSNSNSASLSVLSTESLSLIANASVGVSPMRLCVSPDGSRVYVACKGSNCVSVVSASGSTITSVKVGKEPIGIGISGDGSHVYVSNYSEGTVSVIDANANFVIKTTRPQPHSRPYGVAVKP